MNKYILFEPHMIGLSNFIITFEMACAVSSITNRTLVLPPSFYIDHISPTQSLKDFVNISDIFDLNKIKNTFNCIDYNNVPEFKDKIDLISSHESWFSNINEHIDNIFYVTFEKDLLSETNTFLTFNKNESEDFLIFSNHGSRSFVELDVNNQFLFFNKNLFGYYWYRIYENGPQKRNELKRKINNSILFNSKFYEQSKQISNLIGEYNSIHIRRNDFLITQKNNIDTIDTPKKLLNVLEYLIPNDLPLYISTDEKDLGFFDLISKKYKIYFYSDFDFSKNLLHSSIIEQLVCFHSNLFYGIRESTYTKRINFLRAWERKQNNDSIFLNDLYSTSNYSNPMPWVDKKSNSHYTVYHWTSSSHPQWTFELE